MTDAAEPRARLAAARLYLVIDATAATRVVPAALEGGVDVVQLREKHASDDEILRVGGEVLAWCEEHGALFIVNDRPDLAGACGAHGVHVGQDDQPLDSVRSIVGEQTLVGVSTHSPAQVDAAEASTADYLGVGPVYETPTKEGRPAVGLDLVRYAAGNARKPWFAIGGIDAERAPLVVGAGASRVAVVRAIRDAGDPRAVAESLRAVAEQEPLVGQAQ
jgi:thiamine-phosphate pyrophosphorylase